jgi:hypothetical protein
MCGKMFHRCFCTLEKSSLHSSQELCKFSKAWWQGPVVLPTQEAEAGLLEPRSPSPAWEKQWDPVSKTNNNNKNSCNFKLQISVHRVQRENGFFLIYWGSGTHVFVWVFPMAHQGTWHKFFSFFYSHCSDLWQVRTRDVILLWFQHLSASTNILVLSRTQTAWDRMSVPGLLQHWISWEDTKLCFLGIQSLHSSLPQPSVPMDQS